METPLSRFPQVFADSTEELAVEVHGEDEKGPWRLHEASHIYYMRKQSVYLALLEAVRPHPTRRDYWESRNRFMFAMVADTLAGPWTRVESHSNEFALIPSRVFEKDGTPTAYDQISHPGLIRAGVDEKFEIEDHPVQLLFQAFDAAATPDYYDYDDLPWELSVMTNKSP
jgi:hypothetical protein